MLEVAIAIAVLSVVSSFFMSKTFIISRTMRMQSVKNNMEIITAAIASYLSVNKRLPCAATHDDGLEVQGVFIGEVPFITLGIPKKQAVDGKGNLLFYAVDINLTKPFQHIYDGSSMIDMVCFCNIIVDRLQIRIQHSNHLISKDVAFILDTNDNKQFTSDGDTITILQKENTTWILRDILLIKYLHSPPSNRINPVSNNSLQNYQIEGNQANDQRQNALQQLI